MATANGKPSAEFCIDEDVARLDSVDRSVNAFFIHMTGFLPQWVPLVTTSPIIITHLECIVFSEHLQ